MLEVHDLPSCQSETTVWTQFPDVGAKIVKSDVIVVLLPIEGEYGGLLGDKWLMQISTTHATYSVLPNDQFVIGSDTYIVSNKPTLFKNNPAFVNFYQFEVKVKNATIQP